jgi:hypothetical protein
MCVPLGHVRQADIPEAGAYVLAAHSAQGEVASFEYDPGRHLVHTFDSLPNAKVPDGQAAQLPGPEKFLAVPGPQATLQEAWLPVDVRPGGQSRQEACPTVEYWPSTVHCKQVCWPVSGW